MRNLATKRKIQTLKGNKNTFMPDIGDLLTYRPASCIQRLTDKQVICKKKKNIDLRIIAIVLSFWYHKRIEFCKKKLSLVRLFPFQHFSWWLNKMPLNGWKFSLTHFPTIYRSDLGICPNRWREKCKIRKCWPRPKIGDLLTSDDLLVWFNFIIWYVIFRGLQNTHFEWWTAITERF